MTYTIEVENLGPSTTAATVTDTLPTALQRATWTCAASAGSACTTSGSGNIDDPVTLHPAGTVTYTLTATVGEAERGTLQNTASVAGVALDPVSGNNSATDSDTLTPEADLAVSQADAPDPSPGNGARSPTT